MLSPTHRRLVRGIDRADSVVWDAHKGLLMPALVTAVLFRDGARSFEAFAQEASYLFHGDSERPWSDVAPRTMECTKEMMALKVYACLAVLGTRLFKGDWRGRFLGFPAEAGGRYALTHCCCDYPTTDAPSLRRIWNNAREGFREGWAEDFGAWPQQPNGGPLWAGHHIRDLLHGGHPTAPANILPVPSDVHSVYNSAYPACYAGAPRWKGIGPDRPYAD